MAAAAAAVVDVMTMSALAPPTAFAVARRDTVQQGLVGGRLLPAAQLAQMRTIVPAGHPFGCGIRCGLGFVSTPLSCGGVSWGHGGSFPRYEARGGVTDDGRAADVAVTIQPTDKAAMKHVESVVDTALCH